MEEFKKSLTRELDIFIMSNDRNRWIEVWPVNMYVRKSHRLVDGVMERVFDFASIVVIASKWRKGYCKAALETAIAMSRDSMYRALLVESVVNENLAKYLDSAPGFERYNNINDLAPDFIFKHNQ